MRLQETRQIDRPLSEVFAFTADFANIEQWDPGVESSRRIDDGPVDVGARYDVVATFGSRQVPMIYQVVDYELDRFVVLLGKSQTVDARDEIRFEAREGGTLVDYTADLAFNNWIRFVAPLMSPMMKKVGTRALDGLVETLHR